MPFVHCANVGGLLLNETMSGFASIGLFLDQKNPFWNLIGLV